jgi:hypothetical protein
MKTDTLSEKALVIYCFVDDFLKKIAPENDKQRKFTDAQSDRRSGNNNSLNSG